MNPKHTNRKALSVASLAGLAAVALTIALPAQAVDFKVSGQVNRAITAVDNGKQSDVGFVDNTGSNSRFRFIGSQDVGNGSTIGLTYEIGLTDNSSYAWDVKQNNTQAGSSAFVDNRLAHVWFQGNWGRIEFGKVWSPGAGTMATDYSGTAGFGGGTDLEDYAGNLTFMDKELMESFDGGEEYASEFVIDNGGSGQNAVFDEMDGLGRQNGINYYTPSFSGFSLGLGVFDGHAFEIAPRYEMGFGDGGKFGIGANYYDTQDLGQNYGPDGRRQPFNSRMKQYGASTGVLLPSGFNATLGYKKTKVDDNGFGNKDSAKNYFGSVGYRTGKHAVAATYSQTNNFVGLNVGLDANDPRDYYVMYESSEYKSKFKAYGLAYVYNLSDSIDLYTSYHMYKLKLDGKNGYPDYKFENIHQLYSGVVVRFL